MYFISLLPYILIVFVFVVLIFVIIFVINVIVVVVIVVIAVFFVVVIMPVCSSFSHLSTTSIVSARYRMFNLVPLFKSPLPPSSSSPPRHLFCISFAITMITSFSWDSCQGHLFISST
jgi:hypothetical protein